MIVGVGVDCEDISRFSHLKKDFARRLFTQREIEYCLRSSNPKEKFASRFCAKEAVKKALTNTGVNLMFDQIEIIKDGKIPRILFSEKDLNKRYKVYLSITHTKTMAMAFVILEKNGRKVKRNIY